MIKIRLDTERCKSCGYCIHFCPKQALSLTNNFNSSGYKYVCVDEEKCIACGICYTVCPDSVITLSETEEQSIK